MKRKSELIVEWYQAEKLLKKMKPEEFESWLEKELSGCGRFTIGTTDSHYIVSSLFKSSDSTIQEYIKSSVISLIRKWAEHGRGEHDNEYLETLVILASIPTEATEIIDNLVSLALGEEYKGESSGRSNQDIHMFILRVLLGLMDPSDKENDRWIKIVQLCQRDRKDERYAMICERFMIEIALGRRIDHYQAQKK